MDSTVMRYDQQHKVGARTKKKICWAGEDSHTCARVIIQEILDIQGLGCQLRSNVQYVGPIQTGFLITFLSRLWQMIPVKNMPQEWKKQESGGFLQELPT